MENNYLPQLISDFNNEETIISNSNQSLLNENKKKEQATTKSKKLIPDGIIDLLSLSKRVVQEWKNRPEITITWIDAVRFEDKVLELEEAYNRKHNKISKRSPVVADLKELDNEIKKNLNYVKQFIAYKFGKNKANSHYSEFGIIRSKGGKFILGEDRDQIENSLQKLVEAANIYNMDHDEYGKQYWQNVYNKYIQLKQQSVQLTQTSSGDVKDLKNLKDEIKQILNAIKNAIKLNYKDNYKNVMMEFGFLKTHN